MKRILASALVVTLTLGVTAMAQQITPPSVEASDPKILGWIPGFPPPANKVICFTNPDYFVFPKLCWTVCHFRELMPNVGVNKGTEGARHLAIALDPSIDDVTFTPLGSDDTMTWYAAFHAIYTDGIIVLHHGRVVYERDDGCLTQNTSHGAMSVTKSLTGLLGETLVAEGKLDKKVFKRLRRFWNQAEPNNPNLRREFRMPVSTTS